MKTIVRPFQLKITNHGEIRMGSPYNRCDIELIDFEKIQLPKHGWQDKYAWSDDSQKLILIKWDLENNEPAFHFFILDTTSGAIKQTERIFGLVNTITLEGNKIKYNKFLLDREKSKEGHLCCNSDEVYDLT